MKTLLNVLLLLSCALSAHAQQVFVLPLNDEIDARTWQHTRRACQMAVEGRSDLFVVHLNTYGGAVDAADSIRTALLDLPIPTVALVDHNAASAGALIALACDTVFMTPGSSMGAATVVNGAGEAMPDKYQSYMSSIMRSTAQSHGKWTTPGDSTPKWRRDPTLAAAMVRGDSIITFSTDEALAAGFSDGTVRSLDEALEKLNIDRPVTTTFRPSLSDNFLGFLSTAGVRAVLIMLILGGIYMEMHTPGLGVAAAVAVVAASLYFLPMCVSHTIAPWILIMLVAGIVLIALEVFVIPGFGICGFAGIAAIIIALTAAIMPARPEGTELTWGAASTPLGIIVCGAAGAIGLIAWLTSSHGPKFVRRHSELMLTQDVKKGYIGVDMEPGRFVGMRARAMTDLRPSGKIIIDSTVLDAVSTGQYVEAGTHVHIVRYENAQLYVEPANLQP